MEKTWTIREYRDGDEEGVLALYEAVYKRKVNKEQWLKWWVWQHKNNPCGKPIIWFAESNGKLVGQYEIIRLKMKFGDHEFYGSHSQDTMTHPDFRRQGIFEVLANKTYEQAGEEGIEFVIGFPNQYSHPGFVKKLSWYDVCLVPRVFKPLNIENTFKTRFKNKIVLKVVINFAKLFFLLLGKSPKPPHINGLKITKISSFDNRIDDLWKSISRDYNKILVTRTSKYLNWRYVEAPHKKYTIFIAENEKQILGYIVLRCVEKEEFKGGEIIDIFAKIDKDIITHLLYKATKFFQSEEVDSIYCWVPNKNMYKKILKRNGFFYHPPTPPFIVRRNLNWFSEDQILNPDNWFITMGDSDHH